MCDTVWCNAELDTVVSCTFLGSDKVTNNFKSDTAILTDFYKTLHRQLDCVLYLFKAFCVWTELTGEKYCTKSLIKKKKCRL